MSEMTQEEKHVALKALYEMAKKLLPGQAFMIVVPGEHSGSRIESASNLSAEQQALVAKQMFMRYEVNKDTPGIVHRISTPKTH